MRAFGKNLRYALRSLRRRPGFTAVAVATIAVAIAGTTAMFSVVNGVLLRPLPFHEPDALVTLDVMGPRGFYISTSIPNYRDWQDRNRAFASYGGEAGWSMALTGIGQAGVLDGRAVIGNLFGVLGITAAVGRVFDAPEAEPGTEPVVVLGHGLWQRRFGGDPGVVGTAITLDNRPYTVVGVLPRGVGYPSADTEIYVNMGSLPGLPWDIRGSSFGTRVVARLAPNVTLAAARQDLARVGREVEELAGEPVGQPELRSLEAFLVGDVSGQLWVLMGAVGFVLLIATANIGSLLLARGEDRRQELAVRTALGARRSTLVRELVTESLVLAGVGGAVGLVLATASLRIVVPILPQGIPVALLERVAVDYRVLLFAVVVTVLTGLTFGTVPALRASRPGLIDALKEGGRGSSGSRQRLRAGLVVTEVALSLVLLIGAGLMLSSLARLRNADKGFAAEGRLTARIGAGSAQFPEEAQWRRFYDELLLRATALPGVRTAALTLLVPLADRSWEMGVTPEGVPREPETSESVLFNVVTEEYFDTFGIPLVRGRAFAPSDRNGTTPVVIVDESMARRFWPDEDAIGKRLTIGEQTADSTLVYRTIVGVSKNVRHYELQTPSRIQMYVPFRQTLSRWGMTLSIALAGDVPPHTLAAPLERTLAAIDANVPLYRVTTLDEYVSGELSGSKTMSTMLTFFGIIALLLAALGIFGVVSYAVTRRTREIGIRMALGADAARVVRWISRQGLALTGVGVLIGLAGAVGLTRLLGGLLYEVEPLNVRIYATFAAVLTVVAAVAAYLPARRATMVHPAEVLKEQ